MRILKFGLFENFEGEDGIEYCRDLAETFNENEDKFEITNITQGWYNGSFLHKAESANDKICLFFKLKFRDKSPYFKRPITIEQIDDSIVLLNKSKNIILKLQRYCPDIIFNVDGLESKFFFCFENKDSKSKRDIITTKIFNNFKKYIADYEKSKTLIFNSFDYRTPAGLPEIPDSKKRDMEKLYNLLILHPEMSGPNYFQIRYSMGHTEDITSGLITINIGSFKYKTSVMSRFKPIKLNKNETDEIMKVISSRMGRAISSSIHGEKTENDVTIDDKQIIIKIK